MRLALYEPDIPQNAGSLMRLCSCFDVPLDIIEPCGFAFNDRKMRRAGMDYIEQLSLTRHQNWDMFYDNTRKTQSRIVLLTTKTTDSYLDFTFQDNDILLAGRESAGVPDAVHNQADACVTIPMVPVARSINVSQSCAIVLSEALRQTNGFAFPQQT